MFFPLLSPQRWKRVSPRSVEEPGRNQNSRQVSLNTHPQMFIFIWSCNGSFLSRDGNTFGNVMQLSLRAGQAEGLGLSTVLIWK